MNIFLYKPVQARSQPISLGSLDRGAEGAENEMPKASKGWGMGRGYPLPSRLEGLGQRRKLPQRGQGHSLGEKRCYACAVLAMGLCLSVRPSVCLSQVGILLKLDQIISLISSLPCQMCNWPVFLAHIFLRCPPRLCPWFTPLRHVHHSSQHPHFLLFP